MSDHKQTFPLNYYCSTQRINLFNCAVEWTRCFVGASTPPSFTQQHNVLLLVMIVMIMTNSAINSINVHLKVKRITKSTWTKPWAVGNLQFRAAVTINGISFVQFTADRIYGFKFKKMKLQTATDSGDDFCNVAAILSFVQNLWFLLDLLY